MESRVLRAVVILFMAFCFFAGVGVGVLLCSGRESYLRDELPRRIADDLRRASAPP